jgi:uncharacterized protein (TIGR02599 family)
MKLRLSSSNLVRVQGFTLIELLLSMTIVSILMIMLVTITGQTSAVWRDTTGKSNQFREARNAFEAITRNLSQATLNTYYDYYGEDGKSRKESDPATFVPATYGRQSELRFQTGRASTLLGGGSAVYPGHALFFQAPLGFTSDVDNAGLENLLNTWGYYVRFRDDPDRPAYLTGTSRHRFRLMEFMEPAEDLKIYAEPEDWLDTVPGGTKSHVIASNIILLSFLPKLPSSGPAGDPTVDPGGDGLAPAYAYDSTTRGAADKGPEFNSFHQLPPVVEVLMVAIDETSASKLENGATPPSFDLEGRFQDASPARRKEDLKHLEQTLANMKVSYRVFSTEVSLRGAKWSREQTN